MKKKLSIIAISLAILVSGCAQKKVTKKARVRGRGTTKHVSTYSNPNSHNIKNGYHNVDLFGNGKHNLSTLGSNSGGSMGSSGSMGGNSGNTFGDNSYGGSSSGLKKIYFGFNQYVITPDKLPTIIYDAKVLSDIVENGSRVKIEGHCDARGTDEYNYALGLRRAKATKEAIVSQGIAPSDIIIVSMGESSPDCIIDYSEECLAKNRRAELKVIK